LMTEVEQPRRHTMRALPSRLKRVERHNSLSTENLSPTQALRIRCVGNYDLGRTLGKGQFGKVKLATHILTGATVAIKIINKKKLNKAALELVQREIRILKQLHHPNVIQLYEVLETDRVLFLVMEHASGGEALDFVVTHGKISEDKARVFFQQIISALSYCHKLGIVHRDLKAENLLLDSDLNIKLIDFGLANIISPTKKFNTPCGSPNYAAPEIIRKEQYNGPEVDIWCVGVVLFVFLCGKLPFKGKDLETLFHSILSGNFEIPDSLSSVCVDLLRSMLENDTEKRITIPEIVQHPWVCKSWEFTEHPIAQPKVEKIEPKISSLLEQLGISVEYVLESLQNNRFNQATATYNLLLKSVNPEKSLIVTTRTKSEQLCLFPASSTSTSSSPVGSLHASSPTSPSTNSGKGLPESFATLQQRRIAQAHRTRGHRRNRSDFPGEIIVQESDTDIKELEKTKRAQSECIPIPDSRLQLRKPESPPDVFPLIEPIAPPSLDDGANDKIQFLPEEQHKPWLMLSPQRTIGHRRYKSEDRVNEQILPRHVVNKNEDPAKNDLLRASDATNPSIQTVDVPKLTEQDIQNWKATEESERQQISESSDPKFSMFLTWTKKMLTRRNLQEQNQPRECRTSFSSSTTSRKHPSVIISEIKRVMGTIGVSFEMNTPFCLKAHCPRIDIRFEVEVCAPPNLTDIYVIRLRRISGDWIHYKELCQTFLGSVHL